MPRNNATKRGQPDDDNHEPRERKRTRVIALDDNADNSSTASSGDLSHSDTRAADDGELSHAGPVIQDSVIHIQELKKEGQTVRPPSPPVEAGDPVITTATRPYFGKELAARLDRLARYKNDATRCYSLSNLPVDQLEFGKQGRGMNDRSEYLCIREKPVTIWIVGEVVLPLFKEKSVARRKPTVLIRPLIESELARGFAIMDWLSKPPLQGKGNLDGLWLSRWAANRSVSDDDVPYFREVYDAEEVLKAKRYMARMPCTDLKAGDIVVGEASLTRWQSMSKGTEAREILAESEKTASTSQEGTKVKYQPRTWESWRVELRLEALWYIYKGSDYYVAESGPGPDQPM